MIITPITLLGTDERGFTAEYPHERTGDHIIVFRKAGSISGRHYHKGLSATKDPEIFIIFNGACTINWRDINSEELHTDEVVGPVKLAIFPNTWHEIIGVTDYTALELNSLEEHKADTFYL